MFRPAPRPRTLFTTQRETVVQEPALDPMMDDSEEEKDAGIIIRPVKKGTFLPGERLLQKVNRDRKKSRKTRKAAKKKRTLDEADIDQLSLQMGNILTTLN